MAWFRDQANGVSMAVGINSGATPPIFAMDVFGAAYLGSVTGGFLSLNGAPPGVTPGNVGIGDLPSFPPAAQLEVGGSFQADGISQFLGAPHAITGVPGGGPLFFVAASYDDCSGTAYFCPPNYSSGGAWHVGTPPCNGGQMTGAGYGGAGIPPYAGMGATIDSGWMQLCVWDHP